MSRRRATERSARGLTPAVRPHVADVVRSIGDLTEVELRALVVGALREAARRESAGRGIGGISVRAVEVDESTGAFREEGGVR